MVTKLRFGAFLAPHHLAGDHPARQFRRSLELVEHLDDLGFEEVWCGEHGFGGWAAVSSPEMFLAAAGQRTSRIRLGAGVPAHAFDHPLLVAKRAVQLDHMTAGRAMLATGPVSFASHPPETASDPTTERAREDEAIGVIKRLLAGEERVTHRAEWFELQDAELPNLPQGELPIVTTSMASPAGMNLAGTHGIGVLSVALTSGTPLDWTLRWSVAEAASGMSGNRVDRRHWRMVLPFHLAETVDDARRQSKAGFLRWCAEHGCLGEADRSMGLADDGIGIVGTPDDLVAHIRKLEESTGGFGIVLGVVHDWANVADTQRSWDLVARHVVPELTGGPCSAPLAEDHAETGRSFDDERGAAVTRLQSKEWTKATPSVPPTARSPLGGPAVSDGPDRDPPDSPAA